MRIFSIAVAALLLVAASAAAQQNPGDPIMNPEPAPFRLARVTLAVTNVEKMVAFYENVFQMKFEPFDAGGTKLYAGMLLGQNTLFCPNTLAKVEAEQARHQYDIVVNDLDGVAARAKASGGTIRNESVEDGGKSITVVDPDGNTMIFHQGRR